MSVEKSEIRASNLLDRVQLWRDSSPTAHRFGHIEGLNRLGSNQLLDEIQSKYRSDHFSRAGKRFGVIDFPPNVVTPEEILKLNQQMFDQDQPALSRENSDKLIDEIS